MKLSRHLYAILGLVTILSAIGMSNASRKAVSAPSSSSNVNVTNGVNSPIPTMSMGGTVSVSTMPAVKVSGTSDVSVVNTPTVHLADDAAVSVSNSQQSPLFVKDTSLRAPVATTLLANIDPGSDHAIVNLYTVPAGKQVEIKDAYAWTNSSVDQNASICVLRVINPLAILMMEMHRENGPDASGNMNSHGEIYGSSMVAPAGSQIQIMVYRDNNTGSQMHVQCGFNGFVEDAP